MTHRRLPPAPRRFHLDFHDESFTSNVTQPSRPSYTRAAMEKHAEPPGFPSELSARDPTPFNAIPNKLVLDKSKSETSADRNEVSHAYQASWTTAFSPVRSMVTSAFALYMTGNSVHMFSVGTTITVLFMQIKAMVTVRDAFKPALRAGVPIFKLLPQMLLHLSLAGIGVGFGLYRANEMGFLPTTQSHWVSLLPARVVREGGWGSAIPV